MSETRMKAWVCTICGYVHYGPEPPEECPVCGADASQFEAEMVDAPPAAEPVSGQNPVKIVIVGAGIAGVSAAEAARKAAPQADICLLSNDNDLPYYRLNLTRYLAGELNADQLTLHPESWYVSSGIRLLCAVEITAIDLSSKTVSLDDGEQISYDRLVITTGAHPFLPPVPGVQLPGVKVLRTRSDADAILAESQGKPVICIGGGLLGLEAAGALANRGASVTVLENQPWLMPRQLNQPAARVFQAYVEKLGITILTNVKVKELTGSVSVNSVVLDDGASLSAGTVVFSAGVRSNTSLAAKAGLDVRQGILVDDSMRTSHPDVFAAGDAAEHAGTLYGTWVPAQTQGTVAGACAAGQPAAFRTLPRTNTLKVLGIDLFSIGIIQPAPTDIVVENEGPDSYMGFIFQAGVLAGAILLGDASKSAALKRAVENHLDCSSLLARNPGVQDVLDFIA